MVGLGFFFLSESHSQQVGEVVWQCFESRWKALNWCYGLLGTHQQVSPQNLGHFGAGRIVLRVWQYSQATPCVASDPRVLNNSKSVSPFGNPFHEKNALFFSLSFFLLYTIIISIIIIIIIIIIYLLVVMQILCASRLYGCQRVKFVH